MKMQDGDSNHRMQAYRAWLVQQLCRVPRLWREAVPVPAAAAGSLDIALRPSPLAHRALRVLLVAQLLYSVELLLLQHVQVAGMVLALAAVLVLGQRRAARAAASAPRRLLLLADGRLCLLLAGGAVEPATLLPSSLRLGSWLLLVLRSGPRTHRLLIGPDTLDAAPLACLRRRLGAAAAGGVPGYMAAAPTAPPVRR